MPKNTLLIMQLLIYLWRNFTNTQQVMFVIINSKLTEIEGVNPNSLLTFDNVLSKCRGDNDHLIYNNIQ